MSESIKILNNKLEEYKKKYYLNILIKGSIIGFGLLISAYLIFTSIEYFGRFNSIIRGGLLSFFIVLFLYVLFYFIGKPIYHLFIRPNISDKEAAIQIGNLIPSVKDKLLNLIELNSLSSSDMALINASIDQKSSELKLLNFSDAIDLKQNRSRLKYFLIPLIALFFILGVWPQILTNGTERIVKFREEFKPIAPFSFNVLNKSLRVSEGDDLNLKVSLSGKSIPGSLYLIIEERKVKMRSIGENKYEYILTNLKTNTDIYFLAGGFESNPVEILVAKKPYLGEYSLNIDYPSYLKMPSEKFSNISNLNVPEGSIITWNWKANNTDEVRINGKETASLTSFKALFKDSKNIVFEYSNRQSDHSEFLEMFINVIKDEYPKIELNQILDSTTFNYLAVAGVISDDYGLSSLSIKIKKNEDGYSVMEIPIDINSNEQSFYKKIEFSPMWINPGDKLTYFLEVRDNDGINGKKSTKTQVFSYTIPSTNAIKNSVEKDNKGIENELNNLINESSSTDKNIENLLKKLKVQKELKLSDRQEIEKLLKQKQDLNQQINDLLEKLENNQEKEERFNNEKNKETDRLKEILKELLKKNPETLKELEEALKDKNTDPEDSLEKLEEVQKESRNSNKDLKRTLNLFKDIIYKKKVENLKNDLLKTAEDLEKSAEEKSPSTDEKINEDLKENFKDLEELKKMEKELNKKSTLDENKEQDLKNEAKKLEKEEKKDAFSQETKESKRRLAKKMKDMAESMAEEMEQSEMEQLQLDMDALRDILENLLYLSFEQEDVLVNFKNISVDNPKYIYYSQKQLKIANETKIVEDSLYALANRVLQIKPKITTEITKMKNAIDESLTSLKERNLAIANQKQHYALTSINNLALLLNDTFREMQQMGKGKGSGKSPKPSDSLGEKQGKINKRLEGLTGKDSKSMSQELAKLIQEQAELRRQIEELQEKLNGTKDGKNIGKDLEEIKKEMKNAEIRMNKKSTKLTPKQKEMETRLLQVEKALKEQDQDDKRKSTEAKNLNKIEPKELQAFKKQKQSSLELTNTISIKLTPYYKQETNKYFNQLIVPRGTQK